MQTVIERRDLRNRQTELEIFHTRVEDITLVLTQPSVLRIFKELPAQSSLLDLFTGTGAGIKAVHDTLSIVSDNRLCSAVGLDRFVISRLDRHPFAINTYTVARYSLNQAETKRNLSQISGSCDIEIVRQDALGYLSNVAGTPSGFSFDLVTAFAVPLHGTEATAVTEVIACLLFVDGYNVPAIFTFSKKSQYQMHNLQRQLEATGLASGWTIYEKPRGLGNPDWDCWILTNRPLDFKSYSKS